MKRSPETVMVFADTVFDIDNQDLDIQDCSNSICRYVGVEVDVEREPQ